MRHSVPRTPIPSSKQAIATPAELPGVPRETDDFIRAVLEQTGLVHRHYRPRPLVRRVAACLRALDAQTLHTARAMVESDRSLGRTAADALLIGATGFYRDRRVFDALAQQVIPMLARSRGVVDVWSVGCSDGAELYSVAMIMAEQKRWCVGRVLGSDCRPSAIDQALAGAYRQEAVRDLPPELASKYLKDDACGSVVVTDELRRMATWRVQDALTICDYACWDLILCRNMAIYLDLEAARELWNRLVRALRPGGMLVVGRAERPSAGYLRRTDTCMYAKEQEA